MFVNRWQDNWDSFLPTAEFVLNSHIHSAHDRTPFEVLYGYTPEFTIPIGAAKGLHTINERLEALRFAREDAEAALRMSKQRMKDGRTGQKEESFEVGQPVWLTVQKLKF